MSHKPFDKDQVYRAVTNDLVRDVDLSVARVERLWHRHLVS